MEAASAELVRVDRQDGTRTRWRLAVVYKM